jgi:Protein of unknown function (DUF1552)
MTTPHDRLARRRFLRGAGGVAIGLPFLLAREGSIRAQAAAPRERLITVYFPQGIPASARNSGYTGILLPLAPFQAKLTMIQGLDCHAESPNNGHSKGSSAFACGFGTPVLSTKGGPSLDWVVHEATKTDTPLPTLSAGFSGGDDIAESVRYHHSWRGKNQPNEVILDTLKLFQAIFGGRAMMPVGNAPDPVAILKARQRVSVLDAVLADYQHVVGDAGGYSPSVRSLISNHLETVRELEKRAVANQLSVSGQGPTPTVACKTPAAPTKMDSILGPPVNGLNPKSTPYFQAMWSIMVDLYVLAMRCDLVRFGNLLCGSGGDSYPYTCPFGTTANIHGEGFHLWLSNPNIRPIVNEHMLWTSTRIAELLGKLDDPSYKDVDGGTLLDNTTLVMGTELGDDVANHGMTDMPFWIGGARKRFKQGNFSIAGGHTDVDLYNTILRSHGVMTPFGDQAFFKGTLPILA